jgi:hypothetical protein
MTRRTQSVRFRFFLEKRKAPPEGEAYSLNSPQADYFLSSAFFASAFFAAHAAQGFSAVQPSHFFSAVQQAFFSPSAFLALQPQVSQARAEEPATNNAIAAILIILFMVITPVFNLTNRHE